MAKKKIETGRVDCYKCVHMRITWDQNMPYACDVMGFKSRILPSIHVYRTSGKKCLLFKKKPGR